MRKEKGKERWKEDSLRKVGRMDAHTDSQVILYSVQCYAVHWTDKNVGAVGGRNFGLPIDLAHCLYNSLLLLHKP